MSKELEAFNEIIDKFAEQIMRASKEELTAINKTNAIEYLYRTPQVRLLQEALQRLEAIDNANPSKALECLEWLIKNYIGNDYYVYEKDIATIKQALLKAQEMESENKALLEENKDLYFELALAEKQYKELMEYNKQYKNVLEIIKRVYTDLCFILSFDTFEEYNRSCDLISVKANLKRVNKEEFELLKRYFK